MNLMTEKMVEKVNGMWTTRVRAVFAIIAVMVAMISAGFNIYLLGQGSTSLTKQEKSAIIEAITLLRTHVDRPDVHMPYQQKVKEFVQQSEFDNYKVERERERKEFREFMKQSLDDIKAAVSK